MAFSLSSIQRSRSNRPPRVVVYGPHKIGKSTFAASAPKPIVIQTEEGLDGLDVPAFPLAKSFNDVLAAIGSLYSEDHDFQTVVIDSLDWLEPLIWKHTAEAHGKEDLEAFGYGKGYLYAADTWRLFLDGLNALRNERGMAVICLAHHQIKRFDSPDSDPYDRYQIKLHDRASAIVQEWADVIGFANYEVLTTKTEVGFNQKVTRGIGTGRRMLHLVEQPAYQAGNRYGLPSAVDLTWPAFISAFAQSIQPAPQHEPVAQAA